MNKNHSITNLEELLERIESAAAEDPISVEKILEVIGRRAFGPLLLLAGLVTLAPLIGDIPGVPTLMGLFVLLISIQLLIGRTYFWLPEWLLKRKVKKDKLTKVLKWLHSPARFIDRFLRHRLKIFATGSAVYTIAVACIIIALIMPVMEFVPFSANAAGAILTFFGLSLIARDGLPALIAIAVMALTLGFGIYYLL